MPVIGRISVGDGATFTPSVSSAGELSWTNNKNLPNPETVDLAQAVIDSGSGLFLPLTGGTVTGSVEVTGGVTADITGDVTGNLTGNVTGNVTGDVTGDVTGVASGNLPLTGGTVTGDLSVSGTITGNVTGNLTGNVTGNADTATNATNDSNGNKIDTTYLPLAGGTMTGTGKVEWSYESRKPYIVNENTSYTLGYDHASYDGALISLRSADHTDGVGAFELYARANNQGVKLTGRPDGELIWNGKHIERVNASGTNYIRYESGLQICFGGDSVSANSVGVPFANSGSKSVTFPVAFNSVPKVFANIYDSAGYWNAECQTVTTTSVTISIGGNNTNAKSVSYVAIGYWK